MKFMNLLFVLSTVVLSNVSALGEPKRVKEMNHASNSVLLNSILHKQLLPLDFASERYPAQKDIAIKLVQSKASNASLIGLYGNGVVILESKKNGAFHEIYVCKVDTKLRIAKLENPFSFQEIKLSSYGDYFCPPRSYFSRRLASLTNSKVSTSLLKQATLDSMIKSKRTKSTLEFVGISTCLPGKSLYVFQTPGLLRKGPCRCLIYVVDESTSNLESCFDFDTSMNESVLRETLITDPLPKVSIEAIGWTKELTEFTEISPKLIESCFVFTETRLHRAPGAIRVYSSDDGRLTMCLSSSISFHSNRTFLQTNKERTKLERYAIVGDEDVRLNKK